MKYILLYGYILKMRVTLKYNIVENFRLETNLHDGSVLVLEFQQNKCMFWWNLDTHIRVVFEVCSYE